MQSTCVVSILSGLDDRRRAVSVACLSGVYFVHGCIGQLILGIDHEPSD